MHVVIADSSQTILNVVSKQIVGSGNDIKTFSDGAAVLDYINSDAPLDILLTGLELPNISGLELCWMADVRAQAGDPNYIIVMSSSADIDKLIEALDSGADDFLRKPFVEGELLARMRAAERTLQAQHELVELASTDPLTGVANRRTFFNKINRILSGKQDTKSSKMIMLDIDYFKKVNDDLGHDAGDIVLKEISKTLSEDEVIFGRLGGEEFAAFLPCAGLDEANRIAENMRARVANLTIDIQNIPVSVTCSFGISEQDGDDTIDTLLKRADQALYAAKNGGRNRTIIWGSTEHHSCMEDSIYS